MAFVVTSLPATANSLIPPGDAEYNTLTNQIMIADTLWRGQCARHGRSRRSPEPSAASHGAVAFINTLLAELIGVRVRLNVKFRVGLW